MNEITIANKLKLKRRDTTKLFKLLVDFGAYFHDIRDITGLDV